MHRKMAEKAYREEQWQHRYDSHIAPINRLVDFLKDAQHGDDDSRRVQKQTKVNGRQISQA